MSVERVLAGNDGTLDRIGAVESLIRKLVVS